MTWLAANQTAGGVYPFLFTYSPDINGRAVAPQMDTPANRITWGGCITTHNFLTSLMSANTTGTYQAFYGYYKTCFYNSVPAPNYLMAAVVGDLQEQSLGETTSIVAEPSVLSSAASEFSNLQAILNTVEQFVQTPFIWGSYRIVIMPPSFPMGGASQPLLSFLSQTTIVGDQSQEYVLVRSVAQQWTGNQVTPNNWEDFWLNEGFTTYVERMVMAQLFDQNFAYTEAFSGNISLASQVTVYGA